MTSLPNDPFLAAARGQQAAHTPVWFMRQAGRSLPEYKALRGEGSILDAIKKPELAKQMERKTKAIIQTYQQSLINNLMH